jgi:superkiller protein 3
VESYRRALTIDPKYAWAWNGLGLAFSALDLYVDACVSFEQATKFNRDDAWFWHNWGDALLKLGDCEDATEMFAHALDIDPHHAPSRDKLKKAQDCLERGQGEEG